MHSTLRKELCRTPRVFHLVRTRPIRHTCLRKRAFSSRTCLLNQTGPKDNSAGCAGTKSESPGTTNDAEASPIDPVTSAKNISANIEKWIQTLSERGQPLDVWDTISEQDENGRRTLLPHVRRDLEDITAQSTRDNNGQQSFGLEIRDGRIRALSSSELRQEKEARSQSSERSEDVTQSSNTGGTRVSTPNASKSFSIDENANVSSANHLQYAAQESDENTAKSGGEPLLAAEPHTGSKFHGSSAARRQRERQSRIKEKGHPIALPDWFQKHNIQLREEIVSRPQKHRQMRVDSEINLNNPDYDQIALFSETAKSEAPKDSVSLQEPSTGTDLQHQEVQASVSGPNGGEPDNSGAGSPIPDVPPMGDTSNLTAIPHAQKRYYVQDGQLTELVLTIGGKLRLPATSSSGSKSEGTKPHLLVHYTAPNGEIFLDRLVEDVARQLGCDLITLDVQDISSLILKSEVDPMITDQAEGLSYAMYEEIYGEDAQDEEPHSMSFDDAEDADEEAFSAPQAFPFVAGKPITIDLKAIFGPRNRKRDDLFPFKELHPDTMGQSYWSKTGPHPFLSLVDSILSTPKARRKVSGETVSRRVGDEASAESSQSKPSPHGGTIVHIKDSKAIQSTILGKHFLAQLYNQIERRRNNGEKIVSLGSSCETGDTSPWDVNRIRALQNNESDEMPDTVIMTPAYSGVTTGLDSEADMRNELQRTIIPKQDRVKRIQTINARHLYEMLQSKDVSLPSFQEGFWTTDFAAKLSEVDQKCLSGSFWSYSHVRRLSAVLASSDFPYSSNHISHAAGILEHSDRLKFNWAKQAQPERARRGPKSGEPEDVNHYKLAQVRSKATKHEKKLLNGVIEPDDIKTTFKDIHIPPETVQALETLTTLSLLRPDAFKYGVLASDRIPGLLLYGPPGTGKTLAAKAVARESGATMLEVSAADINDMYVGEGEKNVQALFSLAKKLSPCIVFLDEADSIFSARRGYGQRVSHRELINQFLKEWDGMNNDSGSAFLMVATNRPMDLDDAVLRRLPRRLLIDLPSESDRAEILKIHLRHEHLAEDVDLAALAGRTPFYSGSDLKNVAVAAALACVREERDLADQTRATDRPYLYPDRRTLTMAHFDKALEEISASISDDMASLREMKKFDEQYGDRKGRKRKSPKWGFKTSVEADALLDTIKVRP